ncbi:citrate synthase/methylcitrate synthase [Alkalihalobacillus sp. 1P02AB]|uniref:citrate synthase/methylcitrate synthase n=1 Tax=Alkalihalobacillus sp. 1P02AB TaxID=3132260 RepID=UPI0039A4F91B
MFNQGLKGVIATQTEISDIDGEKGKLIYRGYDAKELANNYRFEEVAYLLWYAKLPIDDEIVQLEQKLKQYRVLSPKLKEWVRSLPRNMDMMSVLRTSISLLGTNEFQWKPTLEQAIQISALVPSIIAYRYHFIKGTKYNEPLAHLNHIENYLYMLTGEIPSVAIAKALEAYMILTLEHGLNASAFSARVTASTESDLVSAMTSAIGTMKGPLHGGAPSGVLELLEEISVKERAEKVIREKLINGEKLMGFGHRVYKTHDPRSVALKEKLQQSQGQDASLDLAIYVEQVAVRLLEEFKPGRALYTNVEFYAAAIMKSIQLDVELFTPTFTASRIVGWTTHVLEQADFNTIYRPQAEYVGKLYR